MRISDWSSDVCSSDLGPSSGTQAHSVTNRLTQSRRGWLRPLQEQIIMTVIGLVSGTVEKGFVGQLVTLSIHIPIEMRPKPYRPLSPKLEIRRSFTFKKDVERKSKRLNSSN